MPKRLTPRGEAAPPVEPIITGATLPPKESVKRTRAPKTKPGAQYVRNLHHIQARVTLASGRRIELEPRGQRGDADIVNADEQQDPKFLANEHVVFEVISVDQAQEIISKQQTNARNREHSLWDHLRTETNQPYQQHHTKIEEVFEQQGYTVGHVSEAAAGRFTDKNSQVTRASGAQPEVTSVPGAVGDPATAFMQSVPSDVAPEEYHEFLLWKQFKAERAAQLAREQDAAAE